MISILDILQRIIFYLIFDLDISNIFDNLQKMVKPIEPPAVEKPHISDIGMQPQVILYYLSTIFWILDFYP